MLSNGHLTKKTLLAKFVERHKFKKKTHYIGEHYKQNRGKKKVDLRLANLKKDNKNKKKIFSI